MNGEQTVATVVETVAMAVVETVGGVETVGTVGTVELVLQYAVGGRPMIYRYSVKK